MVRSRWQTRVASRTSAGRETDRRRRWRLPGARPARPRLSGARWRSRNPLVSIILAFPRIARPCPGTVRRRKCVYRRTRRKFSRRLSLSCHVIDARACYVVVTSVDRLRTLWQEIRWRRRDYESTWNSFTRYVSLTVDSLRY